MPKVQSGLSVLYGEATIAPDSGSNQKDQFIHSVVSDYEPMLRRYLQRILSKPEDVEDVLQDVFVRLVKHEEPHLITGNFRAYLFQTVTNLIRDRYRRQKVRKVNEHVELAETELPCLEPSPEDVALTNSSADALKRVLNELQPKYRNVFIGHVIKEKTYSQISRDLGISEKTVQRYMAHAIAHCRHRLRGQL